MKKSILLLVAFLNLIGTLSAQPSKIEKSEAFDEPIAHCWSKILLLKNGNTFFFRAIKKEGVEIIIYDKQRKQIAKKMLESKIWDVTQIQEAEIKAVYEIAGEPVIFLDKGFKLYRIRLNAKDGSLVNEEMLGAGRSEIEKDDASDCYAVFLTQGIYDPGPRATIILHFDETHKKLNEQTLDAHPLHDHGGFSTFIVNGNKCIYIVLNGFNKKKGGDESIHLVVSKLNAGESTFKYNEVKVSVEFEGLSSVALYDRKSDRLQILTKGITASKTRSFTGKTIQYYLSMVSYIDPHSLEVIDVKAVLCQQVNDYLHKHIDKNEAYSGIPHGMFIGGNNTTTITMEEISNVDKKITLGSIGISQLSDTGAEVAGYVIRKTQVAQLHFPEWHHNERRKGYFHATGVNVLATGRFMSYDFLSTKSGDYVIFNDISLNINNDEDSDPAKVWRVTDAGAVCYKLNGTGIERNFIFGEPGRKAATLCFLDGSDFDKESNTYATVIVEREGHHKQARVAWLKFE